MRSAAPLIAVLGLGDAGLVHAKGLLAAGARVGVASKRGNSLPGADVAYTSYDAALSDQDVSGVVIATPYESHPELITAASAAGKHIMCEKPLGASVDSILSARPTALKTRFAAGFMRRWDAAYSSARARLDAGELGAPLVLKCSSGDMAYPEKYLRGGATPGAMFRDLAVHDVDLARWLLRDEVASVYARAGALVHPHIAELGDVDTAIAVLSMKGGGQAMLSMSRALGYGQKVVTELVGSKASVEIGDLRMTDLTRVERGGVSTDCCEDFTQRFAGAFRRQMRAFVDLVKAGDEEAGRMLAGGRYASFDDGLRATLVAEAMVESAETGLPVEVADFDKVVS